MGSTVTVTRGTDPWTLCNGVRERLRGWLLSGTTTVEAKTGYHLTRDGELADVRLLRELEKEPMMPRVHVTFLAAHVVPPEYFGRQREYVEAVGAWCADAAAAGADSVDVYCDEGYFTTEESRWVLASGRNVGLLPRVHAGQYSRRGAVQLAAELGCASADGLHHMSDEDIAIMSRYGVPAVVCPATALQRGHLPPVRQMIKHGVQIALGSDHNPGYCGITSMSLVIAMAVSAFGMSVNDALRAATLGGATVLGAPDRGVLAPGRLADIVQWDADHEGAFAWSFGLKPRRVWRGGTPVQ